VPVDGGSRAAPAEAQPCSQINNAPCAAAYPRPSVRETAGAGAGTGLRPPSSGGAPEKAKKKVALPQGLSSTNFCSLLSLRLDPPAALGIVHS
jgi:hypothetical protein